VSCVKATFVGKLSRTCSAMFVCIAAVFTFESYGSDSRSKTLSCLGGGPDDFRAMGSAPSTSKDDMVGMLVEIPAGSNDKWEFDKDARKLVWTLENDLPRVVDYLAYPANYGMVPQTLLPKHLGGDGDPVDILLLGPAEKRDVRLDVRLIGILNLVDKGEEDNKLVAVLPGGGFGHVYNLSQLRMEYPGVLDILELWFSNYKGKGKVVSHGFGDRSVATQYLKEAFMAFDTKFNREIEVSSRKGCDIN